MSDNGDGLPDVFDGIVPEEAPEDAFSVATLYPTGGNAVHLPIADPDNPPTLNDAIVEAGLTAGASTEYWVDGQRVNPLEARIAPGMTITAVGNVKGG